MEVNYHIPVLLNPSVDGLDIKEDGVYVDLTFGGGGHSKEILNRLGKKGHLYGFDQDIDAYENAFDDERFTFVRSNFCYLSNFLRYYKVGKVDGILADLGVSSHHFDSPERGFSFRFDGPLDMRMNQKSGKTAADVLNTYSLEDLLRIFRLYGELDNAYKLSQTIVKYREKVQFEKIEDFVEILQKSFGRDVEKKNLAKIFQALRIEVNDEMSVLKKMLAQTSMCLKSGGRLSIITYHSLEDRLVKNYMKTGNLEGKLEKDFFGNVQTPFRLINNKVIVPSDEEQEINPRSRSAKLRIAECK
jgi:16S rRNA (cytosine1402-N4)-methyltransferase